jgi:hypothetical protein
MFERHPESRDVLIGNTVLGEWETLVAGLCELFHAGVGGLAVETVAAVELLSVDHVVAISVAGIDTEVERLVADLAFEGFADVRVV